jgi:hypothetical protein
LYSESCTHEQDKRESHFAYNQELAQEIMAGKAVPSCRALFNGAIYILPRGKQGRSEARQKTGEKRCAESKRSYSGVHADVVDSRNARRKDETKAMDCPSSGENCANATHESNDRAFNGELAKESGTTGADRGAYRKFTTASPATGQKEITYIRARYEEHECHRAEKKAQGRRGIAD